MHSSCSDIIPLFHTQNVKSSFFLSQGLVEILFVASRVLQVFRASLLSLALFPPFFTSSLSPATAAVSLILCFSGLHVFACSESMPEKSQEHPGEPGFLLDSFLPEKAAFACFLAVFTRLRVFSCSLNSSNMFSLECRSFPHQRQVRHLTWEEQIGGRLQQQLICPSSLAGKSSLWRRRRCHPNQEIDECGR